MGVRINLANIDQIEETTIKWIQWSGQGWRLKSLKHIGYITGNGLGIHLVLNTGREYTFNCDNPKAYMIVLQTETPNDEQQTQAEEDLANMEQLETSTAGRELEKSIDDQQMIAVDPSLENDLTAVDEEPKSLKQ